MIRGHALQTADRYRLFFHAATAACRFAWPVADTAENAGKHIGFTIDEIRLREFSLGDEPYVFGNVGMGWTRPLTIDDAMVVIRIACIGWFHRQGAPLPASRAVLIDTASESSVAQAYTCDQE